MDKELEAGLELVKDGQAWSGVMTLRKMMEDKPDLGPPEVVWIWFAWRGRVTGIFAREKKGKSTILAFISAMLTNGMEALGWAPPEPGRVLWFGLEEHPDDTVLRQKDFGTDPDRFFFLPWSPDPLEQLELAIREVNPDLVVIDSLAAYVELAAPKSGESSAWKALLGPLTRLARKYNVAIVIIMHMNKGKDAEYRDSTAIGAEVDMLIEMRAGDVPGVRMFTPLGRWKVEPFSVIYEEAEGDLPPSFRLAHGELAVDQKIVLFLKANPGSTKRAIRDGVGGASADLDSAVFHLLNTRKIEDRGDGTRSKFHIRQTHTEKGRSHATDTGQSRSSHADPGEGPVPVSHGVPDAGESSGSPRVPGTHPLKGVRVNPRKTPAADDAALDEQAERAEVPR